MEYKKGNSNTCSLKVREIQGMLNRARYKAMALIRESSRLPSMLNDMYYCQKIHHRNTIKSSWVTIAEDGLFGEATENAVKCFQNFLFITENGIVGDHTYKALQNLLSLGMINDSILYGSTPKPDTKINKAVRAATNFIDSLLDGWHTVSPPLQGLTFFFVKGFIVFYEKSNNLTLHVNANQIIRDLLLPQNSRKGKWFRINHNSKFREFRAFHISKSALKVADAGLFKNLGVAGFAFETIDNIHKAFRGELRFCDFSKYALSVSNFAIDTTLKSVETVKVPIGQAVSNYGKAIVKWKYVAKIVGRKAAVGVAAAATTGVVVVGIQVAGAFLTGWEIGSWIEKRWHIGQTAVDFYWELFLGDLVEKYYEWKVNRVICVRYPENWTDEDIRKFHESNKL